MRIVLSMGFLAAMVVMVAVVSLCGPAPAAEPNADQDLQAQVEKIKTGPLASQLNSAAGRKELLNTAARLQDVERLAILVALHEKASAAGDWESAAELIQQLREVAGSDAARQLCAPGHIKMFRAYFAKAGNLREKPKAVPAAIVAIEEATRADAFDDAAALAKRIESFANAEQKTQLRQLAASATKLAQLYEAIRDSVATLRQQPDDPKANERVGYFRLMQANLDVALPMLAKAENAQVAQLTKETLDARNADALVKLARQWNQLAADGKGGAAADSLKTVAVACYQRALDIRSDMTSLAMVEATEMVKRAGTVVPLPAITKSMDLLSLVEFPRDDIAGPWTKKYGEAALGQPRPFGRFTLPVLIDGNYDLAVTFTRHEGNGGFGVMLPFRPHHCFVIISSLYGKWTGIDMIGGVGVIYARNPTHHPSPVVQNGQRHVFLIKVRRSDQQVKIETSFNQEPLTAWEGKTSSLSLYGDWKFPRSDCPAIGAHDCTVTVHSVQLRMISGKATPAEATK